MSTTYAYERMKYGFFVHYIASYANYQDFSKAQSIDEAADGFDVAGFADDLALMHVEYVIFTAWHALAQPLYPSAVTEKWRPGNSARRDLIGEIIDAVNAKGIRVILYTHPRDGHDFNTLDRERTGWGQGYDNRVPFNSTDTPDFAFFDYQKWNQYTLELYKELVFRYGDRIEGLWFDGMGPGRFMYFATGAQPYEYPIVDYLAIRKAVKEVNPKLAMIQNMNGNMFNCDFAMPEGYYGVEFSIPVSQWPACEKALAICPFKGWVPSGPKGSGPSNSLKLEDVIQFTVFEATCASGGGVSWAAGPYCGGGWEDGVVDFMHAVGQFVANLGEALHDVVPSTSWPTISGDTMASKGFLAACTARIRDFEYVHILRMPEDGVILLAPPEDGARLSHPCVIGSKAHITEYSQTQEGIRLRITGEINPLDTAVRFDRRDNAAAIKYIWINDTDKRIGFGGIWEYNCLCARKLEYAGYYEYDERVTEDNGAWAQIAFDGDSVTIFGPIGPELGQAVVLIDGMKAGEINAFAPVHTPRQALFSSGELFGGVHTVRLIKTGGSKLSLDALRISIQS